MSPAEWVMSALSTTDRQSAAEIAARTPVPLTDVCAILFDAIAAGLVERHEVAARQPRTFTRKAVR